MVAVKKKLSNNNGGDTVERGERRDRGEVVCLG